MTLFDLRMYDLEDLVQRGRKDPVDTGFLPAHVAARFAWNFRTFFRHGHARSPTGASTRAITLTALS